MTKERKRQIVSITAAALGGLLVWLIAVHLADVDLIVRSGSNERPVGPGAVAIVAILAGLAAVGLAELLARRAAHPRRTWRIIAGLALAVSLTGPLGATSAGAVATLVGMHLLVGVTLIVGIGGTLEPDRTLASAGREGR